MIIQKYQYGNPLLQYDHRRRGKINTWINQGVKQVGIQAKQAENNIRQFRKADARANRKTKVPMKSNNLAKLQEDLWKIGAFKGIKDRHGREATYNTAVDGIEGIMTRTAIDNAKKMGYDMSSGTIKKSSKTVKPSKTVKITQKKPKQAGFGSISSIQAVFDPVVSYISKFINDITSSPKPIQDSKNTNLQAIFDHKKKFDVDKNYAVVDKKNNTLSIYNKDKLISSYPVTLGSNVGDGMLPLNARYLSDTPKTTGAGVFTLHGRNTSAYPGNEPMYTMRSDSIGPVAQAIHSPANLTNRREFFKTGKKGRISFGCVSADCGVLKKLYKDKTLQTGDSVYVLPEVKGNNLIEKNGKLQMQWKGNNPKTYTDLHGITRHFRYNPNI